MKTKAVRIYGAKELKLEEFELPEIKDDEIGARIVTDSMCMSTYKLVQMGQSHSRAPENLRENPAITGHEFCGVIESVGKKWQDKYKVGQKFILQTAMLFEDNLYSPGFSFPYIGGNSTHIVIPDVVMRKGHLIPYNSDVYYFGSLAEPMACIAAGYHAMYHIDPETYEHTMEIKKGGSVALLASAGPMGLGFIDYAINHENQPKLVVVTDIDEARLARAAQVIPPEKAAKKGVKLVYVNTAASADPVSELKALSEGGYDDVFIMAPVPAVIEQGDKLLAADGCLNFFAGPTNAELTAPMNFYRVHYASTHVVGTTGSRLRDMKEMVVRMNAGELDPTPMITHIGGLDSVIDTVLKLPSIPGGKKLIYVGLSLPLTAIDDFEKMGETNPLFAELARITKANGGLWCAEAERYLLANCAAI